MPGNPVREYSEQKPQPRWRNQNPQPKDSTRWKGSRPSLPETWGFLGPGTFSANTRPVLGQTCMSWSPHTQLPYWLAL